MEVSITLEEVMRKRITTYPTLSNQNLDGGTVDSMKSTLSGSSFFSLSGDITLSSCGFDKVGVGELMLTEVRQGKKMMMRNQRVMLIEGRMRIKSYAWFALGILEWRKL